MDATATERAILVSLSLGAQRALLLASDHPERVAGVVFIAPSLPLDASRADRRRRLKAFLEPQPSDDGWAKYNGDYWRRDYRGFVEFFFGECFSEAHSTKPTEDAVGWGLETDPESLICSTTAPRLHDRAEVIARCRRVQCPVLVIHGTDDRIRPHAIGRELAELTGGRFASIEAGGHLPNVRDPVFVNLLIRDFVHQVGGPA